MNRAEIVEVCEAKVLGTAVRLFGVVQDRLNKFADYEGCANLVYQYERDGRPLILRISFRPERPVGQIQAELHFINYLADNGVRVSRPFGPRQCRPGWKAINNASPNTGIRYGLPLRVTGSSVTAAMTRMLLIMSKRRSHATDTTTANV